MRVIERTELLSRLCALRGTPDIKVVTGVRRSGKSMLLHAFMDTVRRDDASANIVFIDFSDLKNEGLKDYHALHEFVQSHKSEGRANFLCIDEVQLCEHFELAINSLHASGTFDIYLTGSNAFLLSANLVTLFTGRFVEVHVLPFSFAEYRAYWGCGDIDEQFDAYVRAGGFAGSYVYAREQDAGAYVSNVYETVLLRDLVQKYSVANPTALAALSEFLMDNVGNESSASSIAKTLAGAPSHVTVGNYLRYLCDSFLFYRVRRYDIRDKRYLATSDKYYLVDPGMRYSVLGARNMDYGRVYENLVALELLRRGWSLYVGKLYEKEVDFVVMRGSEKRYVQVSDSIADARTFERERKPLLAIRDAYPKLILTRSGHAVHDSDGIQIVDLARWLAGEEDVGL